jgi:molecular chaperone DnaK (HSP70)
VSMLMVSQGLTEIVCTGGNAQLGGSNFDARVAQYFSRMTKVSSKNSQSSDVMVRAAEQARIYLSNNRQVSLALPLTKQGWTDLTYVSGIILPKDTELEMGTSNSTHVFCELTRKDMEALCKAEFQALLKPIREVAIMAGALLPGDARPSIVETALEMESAFTGAENFYKTSSDEEAALQAVQDELDLKASKKAQQNGRKKSRTVAKEERKYRVESRKAAETAQTEVKVKVRGDGISGRPISRVVLVGGATRMPGIGRLIAALTGVVPKKTIDPDEAVALGCAVHVGVLDGKEGMGTVLNPMQAAILRAVVEKQRGEGKFDDFFDDDKEFGNFETFED